MDNNTLRWVIIIVLLAHGIGHIMGFLESWTSISAGFTNQPWILSNNVTIESVVGRAFGLLWLVAMIGFLGAVFGLFAHHEWWRTLAIASAFISLVAILPWWNTVTSGARFGAVLVDVITILTLLPAWGEQIVRNIR
jgi:cytochrome c biogenesis protein CcdA